LEELLLEFSRAGRGRKGALVWAFEAVRD